MYIDGKLYIAHCDNGAVNLVGKMANRHGLIAGATGTGKTVSLQVLAESLSQAGVPCFMADMKGDLSGIAAPGTMNGFIGERCSEFGIDNPKFEGCPARFYDVYAEQGFPMRTTVSSMGPQLLSRLFRLNDVQSGVLHAVFRIADDNGLLLIDLKDLRMMLDFVGRNASRFTVEYGNISSSSVGAIQRAVLQLEGEGGDKFFGEPSFDVEDLFDVESGKGVMNVLAADKLMLNPRLYSTFLLWLLTEIYARLPEVGDMPLPKFVFFFDEAHMLFDGTSKALVEKIEQTIRLIRSKGVGIFFITQVPTDIPSTILSQLGNRIQHALRAYTPQDSKSVRAAARSFRPNPEFDTQEAIMNLATGEALVSFLDEKGIPSVVQKSKILFPLSRIGAITPGQRLDIQNSAPDHIKQYAQFFDRTSAYEVLSGADREEREGAGDEREVTQSGKYGAGQVRRSESNGSRRTPGREQDVVEFQDNEPEQGVDRTQDGGKGRGYGRTDGGCEVQPRGRSESRQGGGAGSRQGGDAESRQDRGMESRQGRDAESRQDRGMESRQGRDSGSRQGRGAESRQGRSSDITRTIFGTMVTAAASSFARNLASQAVKGAASRKTSQARKGSGSSGSALSKAAGSAARSAASTASRRITQELLKGLFG